MDGPVNFHQIKRINEDTHITSYYHFNNKVCDSINIA